MDGHESRVSFAFDTALARYEEVMERSIQVFPSLQGVDDDAFWTRIEAVQDGFLLQVSSGLIEVTVSLWSDIYDNEDFLTSTGQLIGADVKSLTHYSLVWLMLHELHHINLGHFTLADSVSRFDVVKRGKSRHDQLSVFPRKLRVQARMCLELQADHDAIELMLDSYSREKWDELRTKIASISAMMILIEKHDANNGIKHSTHPKAATRTFQLLGHVTEMWSLPAHAKAKARGEENVREEDLPSEEEKQAFSKEVILPAYWDAVALADAADATSIIADLGSPENFFADISNAKLGHWDELKTVGAREWAELKDANDLILPLLPINQATN